MCWSRGAHAFGWPVEVLLEISLDEARRRIAPDLGTLEETADGVLLRTQADPLDWVARLLGKLVVPSGSSTHPIEAAVLALAQRLSRQARRAPKPGRGPPRIVASHRLMF